MTLHLRPLPDTREFYLALSEAAYEEWEVCNSAHPFHHFAFHCELNHLCGCGRIAFGHFIIDWDPKQRGYEWVAYCSRCFVKAKALHAKRTAADETAKILKQMSATIKEKRRGN